MKVFDFPNSGKGQPEFAPIPPSYVVRQLKSGTEFKVLLALLAFGWTDHTVSPTFAAPSLAALMKTTKLSRASVVRALKRLAEKELITKSGARWKFNFELTPAV